MDRKEDGARARRVVARAREPYETALKNFATYEELRTVRNRIVHRSASAENMFRSSGSRSIRTSRTTVWVQVPF